MRIVCISDTHLQHGFTVPEGDLLLHAGDATGRGTLPEIERFATWFSAFPHRHKVMIAGNHDHSFEQRPFAARDALGPYLAAGGVYLQDGGCEIEGLKIWGSPWQPWFYDWAFNLRRGEALRRKWALIPEDTNILITHGPPHQIRDRCDDGREVGCEELRTRVEALPKLRLHVFGHIHSGAGRVQIGQTLFVNAATCDERYRPMNPPQVVDLP